MEGAAFMIRIGTNNHTSGILFGEVLYHADPEHPPPSYVSQYGVQRDETVNQIRP
jgi:hypothetical protein